MEVCPSNPVVPAGYADWSKPRLVRRIAELEKVSGGPLPARLCLYEGAAPRKRAEGASLPGHSGGRLGMSVPGDGRARDELARGDS